jgi:hypothetical protein
MKKSKKSHRQKKNDDYLLIQEDVCGEIYAQRSDVPKYRNITLDAPMDVHRLECAGAKPSLREELIGKAIICQHLQCKK